jgi:competence ComEA-like helix-hairpin-helix protein
MKGRNMKCIHCLIVAFAFLITANPMAQSQGKQQPKTEKNTPVLKGKTININKATESELVKNVPLITPELAKRIVQYRKDNGDFQTLEELLQVEGFNRDLLRKIKTFLLLEGVGGKDCTC